MWSLAVIFFVTNVFEAAKRVTAHKINSTSLTKWLSVRLRTKLLWVRVPLQPLKKTLSLDDLNKTFVKLNQSKSNLADLCLLTTILVAFCSFMRFSKQSRLSRSDFIFNSTYVKVFIEKSKTDIYRERMWVYISAFHKTFLLKQLIYYLALSKISEKSEEFIFRGLSRGKKVQLAHKK